MWPNPAADRGPEIAAIRGEVVHILQRGRNEDVTINRLSNNPSPSVKPSVFRDPCLRIVVTPEGKVCSEIHPAD